MTATEPRTADLLVAGVQRGERIPKVGDRFVVVDTRSAADDGHAVYLAEASGAADVEAVRLREAIQHFVDTAYPNNGEGRTDRLTWTVPEHAFGRLRAALATPPPAAPAALDVGLLVTALHTADPIIGSDGVSHTPMCEERADRIAAAYERERHLRLGNFDKPDDWRDHSMETIVGQDQP